MNIIADLHTHTNIHEHAFSTLGENCSQAYKIGLKAIGLTNHGPALEDGASIWHFRSLAGANPGMVNGVYLIGGAEVNILQDGNVDLEDGYMDKLDLIIASFHQEIFYPRDKNHVNEMLEEVIKNKHINVLGHLGNEIFKFDYEYFISKCNENNKVVEINNHSFYQRPGSDKNCYEILSLCKKYDVPILINSDAHIACDVGKVGKAIELVEKVDFPESLVINADLDRLHDYIMDIKAVNIFNENRKNVY